MRTESAVIDIEGPVDVRTIHTVHKDLLSALQKKRAVQLNVASDAEVDLTFVQLVDSARRFAASANRTATLASPAAAGLRETLQRGGFLATAADRTFWLHDSGAF